MTLNELKNKTSGLLLLDKNILRNFEPRENTLNANIKYWLKNKELILLKKGVYILKDKYEKETQKNLYLEYIANQLTQPSYISTEYILAKYQILSEPVNTITSITTKTTKEITNNLCSFRYYSICPALFIGYEIKYFYNSPVLTATKSKALFDYLYIRFLKNYPINDNSIKNLRINWENITKSEFVKTCSYRPLARSKKIKKVLDLIKKLYYA
ncbi:MAG: hypothetical protein U9M94_01990 [Patescibacteria group bacterium]|nr:hypothetical protein [Patescibacteria group bacterium]